MKSRIFVSLLSLFFLAGILFLATPLMAQEPIKGINAVDAEDDISSASSRSLQQEMKELKMEMQKMRSETEARKRLEVPEEEKGKPVEDILSAVGREYTMSKKGTKTIGYSFSYGYASSDLLDFSSSERYVHRSINHNIGTSLDAEYALRDNISINTAIPFSYKYNKIGTVQSQESGDFGDVSFGLQLQPYKAGANSPTTILSAGITIPTGSSPYKIDPSKSMAGGSGIYSLSAGASFSKVFDPLVAYGSLGYNYGFEESSLSQQMGNGKILNKVDPVSSIGLSFGFGYALSYKASLSLGTSISYALGSKYSYADGTTDEYGSALAAVLNIGTGWRLSPQRSIGLSLGIGLTNNTGDFSLSFRIPFTF